MEIQSGYSMKAASDNPGLEPFEALFFLKWSS